MAALTIEQFNHFFNPGSMTIVGASEKTGPDSYNLMENLIQEGCHVKIYPVNLTSHEILGQRVYSSVLNLPEVVDLAIIMVPRIAVLEVVRECVKKGIQSIIIVTQGFADADEEGRLLQKELKAIIEGTKTRLIGPNSIGVANAFNYFHTSFQKFDLIKRENAMICQSGMFILASADFTQGLGLGVDLGNAADINFTEILSCMAQDQRIRVINIHMEGLSGGKDFLKVASQITPQKAILVYKVGSSEEATKAATSHSGSLAVEAHIFGAAFKKAGIIQVKNVEELNDLNKALLTYPSINGKRVGVITLSGGGGIAVIDALKHYGLEIASISPEVRKVLQSMNPPWLEVGNPVDTWMASLKQGLGRTTIEILRLLLDDDQVDSVIILLNAYQATGYGALKGMVEGIIREARRRREKPVVLWAFGANQDEVIDEAEKPQIVAGFTSPDRAARALAGLYHYHQKIKGRNPEIPPIFEEVQRERVVKILRKAKRTGKDLLGIEPLEILEAYGIRVPSTYFAANKREAFHRADELGYPLVMKIASSRIAHKSDVGGVALNIQRRDELSFAYDEMLLRVKSMVPAVKIDGIVLQRYLPSRIEMIVGSKDSPEFGPVIAFGLGGLYAEILKDVSFRIAPLTKKEAREMIEEIKASPILYGARGGTVVKIDTVVDHLLRVSQLVIDFPEIRELDINPLVVGPNGLLALDAKIVLNRSKLPLSPGLGKVSTSNRFNLKNNARCQGNLLPRCYRKRTVKRGPYGA